MTVLDDNGTAEVTARLMDERRSCRAFLQEPVAHQTLERLVTMAQRAPSWCNTQPWELVITEGAGTADFRRALSEHAAGSQKHNPDLTMPSHYVGIYRDRRRECAWQLYDSLGISHGDREASQRQTLENFELFGAPHVAIITTTETLGTYGVLDCGVYLGNFLLAAQSLGLATVAQAALAGFSPFLHDYFDIPVDRQVVCAVSLGYPDITHPANGFSTHRAPITDVVRWFG